MSGGVPTASSASPARGIALMVGGSVFLTLNDAATKWTTVSLPVGEILFLRAVWMLAFTVAAAAAVRRLASLRVRNLRGQAARAFLIVASSGLFVASLAVMPLADALVITFAAPLFVTALAPVLLGERVDWQRWTAVVFGFVGVVAMLRPGSGTLRWEALLPLGTALAFGLSHIVTRQLAATDSPFGTLAFTALGIVLASALTLPFAWRPPSAYEFLLLALAAVCSGFGQLLMIEAMRWAEAALAAPFHYTAVVWATLLGFVLWGDVPDAWLGAGAMLVIASGLYIWRREVRLAKT